VEIGVPLESTFAELHHCKEHRQAGEFFPLGIVRIDFRVLTDHTVGLGVTYDWRFKLFGLFVFHFQERVEEWQEARLVAYRSLAGCLVLRAGRPARDHQPDCATGAGAIPWSNMWLGSLPFKSRGRKNRSLMDEWQLVW